MKEDWQDELYYSNPFLVNGTFWTAAIFLVQHVITCCLTFNFWGQGDAYLIAISAGQVICAVYSMLLSWLPPGDGLYWVFQFWPLFYLIFFAEIGVTFIIVFCGFYGYAEADQFSLFRISQNIIAAATINGIPLLLLALLTLCVYHSRYYIYAGQIKDFRTEMDEYPWVFPNTSRFKDYPDLDGTLSGSELMINTLM